jgi:glycosyltransferase involved in cell wall biosynthesis
MNSFSRESIGTPRVALSTIGTFHSFDMARQLEAAGALASIHTGYPRFKLRSCGIPPGKIRSFPWMQGPYMAGWIPRRMRGDWEHWSSVSFACFVASTLPECDVYCGLSGSALLAGKLARSRGARYVCDRGSSHIRSQDAILQEEHELWGLPFEGVDPRAMEREECEYDYADAILLPSSFALRSFIERGIPRSKLHLAPYGVDLARFTPSGAPQSGSFDCLFVGGLSVRKGAGYLFAAYEALRHPRKSLTIAGTIGQTILPLLERFVARNRNIRVLGHVAQGDLAKLMSQSHVLVLPSVEEGLALVQAQALACGCPVLATRSTGAEDLFEHGKEGLIVPAQDTTSLADGLQAMADDPEQRDSMARAALQRVRHMGGWDTYGSIVLDLFRDLACGRKPTSPAAASVI